MSENALVPTFPPNQTASDPWWEAEDVPVKLLLVGNSKAGKTGLLASLPPAGYRLFIADFDHGATILRDPKILDPKYRGQVHVKDFQDKQTIRQGALHYAAEGYPSFVKAMGGWDGFGGVHEWGPMDVFVIDSLTFLGTAIMNNILFLNGKAGKKPEIQHYGDGVDTYEHILEMLYSPAVRCNVIVTAHLTIQTDDMSQGAKKLFPMAIGSKRLPKIPRYFNDMVLLRKVGEGEKVRREILTKGTHQVDLGVSRPSAVPAVMEPDLAKLFSLLKGKG